MRIPGGEQFGNVVARPGPLVGASPDAYGAGVARTVQAVGDMGMRQASNDMAQAAAEQKQLQREQAAEAKQLQREQDAEAKAAAREANRVKALTTTAKVRGGLLSLHDQLQADLEGGTIDKSQVAATWTERSGTLLQDSLAGVDPEHRDLVNATLLDDVGRYGQSVNKMVVQRDKKDILTGGLSYIEEMQRYAGRGPKEADEAIANVDTFWKATGPMAGEDPAAAALRVQRFKETVRSNQATALVNADPGAAVKALKNPNYLPELDPKERTNLLHTADAALLRNQQRAAIQAEAAERKQKIAWDAVQTVYQAGKSLTPESSVKHGRIFRGTPYEAAFNALMAEAPANTAFAAQPIQAQAAALTQLQLKMNNGGATPEDIKAYERKKSMYEASVSDSMKDPYQAAAERGLLTDIAPLSLDIKQLPGQMVARAVQANTVSRWAGQEVSLFRPAEAEKVAGVLQAMPPKDKAGAIAGITGPMTPGQRVAFAKQIASHDRATELAIGMATGYTTGNRYASEIMLVGSQSMKDRAIDPDNKFVTGVRSLVAAEIGDAISGKAREDIIDASIRTYYGMQKEGINGGAKRAVELAINGELADFNGRRIPIPAEMGLNGFKDRLAQTSAQDLQKQLPDGAVYGPDMRPVPVADFLTELPRSQLVPVGSGRYNVRHGAGVAMNKAGKPIVIEVR